MDGNNTKIKTFLSALRLIETVYLVVSILIIALRAIPHQSIQDLVSIWVATSFMVLPVLLFKNVLVAILNNGILTRNQKVWILIRCGLYVILTFVAYPVVLAS